MRLMILASNPDLYSHRRLMEEGETRGHEMTFVRIRHCYMNITASKPKVHYRGGDILDQFDVVIPRIRPAMTFYGTAVVRQFESKNILCINKSVAITRARDKLKSLQLLAEKGVPMPPTGFAHSPHDSKHVIEMVGGAPVILKLLEGTQGKGVVLAETDKAAQSVMESFKSLKANFLVQQFIKESNGKDIRCFVIGDKVVASMERVAVEGEFRSNIHQGGTGQKIKITPEERAIAVRAAKVMGLEIAGVDIIRSKNGPLVLEVNASPGLEGIESITDKNIAGMIIDHVEKRITELKTRGTGKSDKKTA